MQNISEVHESIEYFDLALKRFKSECIILLLNKEDIFDEKIGTTNLKDHFPDYSGKPIELSVFLLYTCNEFSGM